MNNTTHYSLKKPEDTDFYNIDDFNDNSDSIDTLIYEKSEGAPQKNSPAGTDFLQLIGNSDSKVYKALVSDIAKYIVETYAGSTIAGAAQALKTAIDSLNSKTSGWRMAVYGVNNSESVNVPLDSTTRGLIFSTGAGASSRGIQGYGVNSAGTVSSSQLIAASGITYTNGTNKVTVANSSGAYASLFVLWS